MSDMAELPEGVADEVERATGWELVNVEYVGIFTVFCFRHKLYTDAIEIPAALLAEEEPEPADIAERLVEGLILAEVMHSL